MNTTKKITKSTTNAIKAKKTKEPVESDYESEPEVKTKKSKKTKKVESEDESEDESEVESDNENDITIRNMTFGELKLLCSINNDPYQSALIISNVIKNDFFIIDGKSYTFNPETISYDIEKYNDKVLYTIVSKLLSDSKFALSKKHHYELVNDFKKVYNDLSTNASIKKYMEQLPTLLTRPKLLDMIDNTPLQIQFKNGYYNVDDCKMYPRIKGTHFITKFINREYTPSTEKQRKQIYKELRKIYPVEEDLYSVLLKMGSALTGNAPRESEMLFLIGKGSEGKSVLLQLIQATMDVYFMELKGDTFECDNKNIDKILNSYEHNRQVLFTWINEFTARKLDQTKFKPFVEGEMSTTKLFKECVHILRHRSLSVATTNHLPNLGGGGGNSMFRRVLALNHIATFTKNEDEVDEENHIYLADIDIVRKIVERGLLNAIFDILVEYCHKYMNGEKLKLTQNFTDTKDIIQQTNDVIQEFVDKTLVITNNNNDRISKDDMMNLFKKTFNNERHLSDRQLILDLKRKGISYLPQERANVK